MVPPDLRLTAYSQHNEPQQDLVLTFFSTVVPSSNPSIGRESKIGSSIICLQKKGTPNLISFIYKMEPVIDYFGQKVGV